MLFVCLLALSSAPAIFGNYASAQNSGTCAANFLPNYYVPYAPGGVVLDTANETALSESTANYIKSVLNSKYPIFDYRNSTCTDSNFRSIVNALQNYEKAVIYSKGHRNAYSSGGYTHYGLIMNNGGTAWDYEIYPRTSSKNTNSFIWHCQTGIQPSSNYESGVGYCGLPIAFQHDALPKWGSTSAGNQVYLGWTDQVPGSGYPLSAGSPQYEWKINSNYNYANVAATYYYYVGQGYSTIYTMNELSSMIYGYSYSYGSSPLYYWLVYYGNGGVGLP